jgi:hypothetical protein
VQSYTLHLDEAALPGDPAALERAVLVRDGFSWGAFVFSFLWFFAHRLWLAGLGVLALVIAAVGLLAALKVSGGAAFLVQLLLATLIGLEASSLRRWTYARGGRPAVDVVTARTEEEAEGKLIARWLARDEAAGRERPASFITPATGPLPVLGLFPEPEGRR